VFGSVFSLCRESHVPCQGHTLGCIEESRGRRQESVQGIFAEFIQERIKTWAMYRI
jgi:hypothetical protein